MKIFSTLAALLLTVSVSQAASVTFDQTGAPTVGLPGFTTWTLTATADEEITGVDLSFAGPMNQVVGGPITPGSTVFGDSNGFFGFIGADVSQDSQFLFNSGDLILAPGTDSETGNSLAAAFTFPAFPQAGIPLPLAQIVIADGQSVDFQGQFAFATGGVPVQGTIPVPEPAGLALIGLAIAGLGFRRR